MRRAPWLVALLAAAGCGGATAGDALDGPRPGAETPAVQVPVEPLDRHAAAVRVSAEAAASWRPAQEAEAPARCAPGRVERLGSRKLAYAATAVRRLTAYRNPGGRPVQRFGLRNVNNYPTVFGVVGVVRNASCRPEWYRVQLPIRPNGLTGYVRADAVELAAVRTRIEIDLSERRLRLFRDGRLVERLTIAVGAPSTPTPTGRYYVNQRLLAGNPAGPYGPAALGVSAFSPTLVYWPQGGPIAIHGTNDPSSIGKAASNGCLRLPNDDLVRLYARTPAGTPVVIRA